MSTGLAVFTVFHVILSLVGIGSGFVVAYGMLKSRLHERWTQAFLATTVATSVTGFLFPFERFLPSHAFGIVSLVLLPLAIHARYGRRLDGSWRLVFALTTMIAQYLNTFVLVAQAFLKIPALDRLAPSQTEPPFAVAQAAVLLAFVLLTIAAARRFRPGSSLRGPATV